jgi:hypothetical protein
VVHPTGAAVVLVASLALSACATATPPAGSAGAPTSVPVRDRGVAPAPRGPGRGATTLPVQSASPQFADRAGLVAEAVRRAGLPQPPTQPVLLSGWALGEGFDTSEQKIAWAHGHVILAADVDRAVAGTGTLALPDGGTRPVDLVGVRPALDRALDGALGRPTGCDGISAARCRLVVSRAVLAEGKVSTSQGQATVPVWRLTIDGLSHTISVIALADGVLARPQRQEPLPGLPDVPPGLHAADSLKGVVGATVDVGIAGGGCDDGLVAHVVELDDMVVVGGTTPPLPKDTACTADYASRPARLQLSRPLGTRPVIDVVSGRPRVVGLPVF